MVCSQSNCGDETVEQCMHSRFSCAHESIPSSKGSFGTGDISVLTVAFFRRSFAPRRWFARPLDTFLLMLAAVASGSFMAIPASASPALVQHISKDAGATASSSLAFPLNNIAGNWIGVVIRAGHSGQVFAVSDSRGNSYRQALQFNETLDTPNGETVAIYYAESVAGGTNTVTVSDSISNNTLRFAILEYSGLAASNSLDAAAAAQGTGTTLNSGTATTTNGGDLVLTALVTANGATYTAGSGFAIEERVPAAPGTKLMVEDGIQAVAGSVAATATLVAPDNWGAGLVAFKAAGGTLPPSITSLTPNNGPVGTSVTIAGSNFGASQGTSQVLFSGFSLGPSSWSPTSITVVVPSGATSGNFTVVVGGITSNGVPFTVIPPPPIITSLSLTLATVGTPITITGSSFGPTQGTSTVTFNGTSAGVASGWNVSTITVNVPAGATSGNVVVTVGGQASNGVAFTVQPPPPSITSVNPASGIVGTPVTISGANLGASQGTSTVTFNGVPATPTNWNATTIVVPVPVGASSGNILVGVGSQASNPVAFSVVPNISSLNPSSGAIGALVSITGSGFGATQGTSTVSFSGIPATPSSWSTATITAAVPAGAATGNVVMTVGGTTSSGAPFTVIPSISSLSPSTGAVGSSVVITGNGFGVSQGTGTVTFNGTVATPTSWLPTYIAVTVPVGATTGNVVVTVGGFSSNAVTYTISPDTTPPTAPTNLTATASSFGVVNLSWTASTDNVAVAGYLLERCQGTGCSTFSQIQSLPATPTLATDLSVGPSTGYTYRVRATDAAGNLSGYSNNATVITPSLIINSLNPTSGVVGTPVTITGTNFGATQGSSTVTFGVAVATPTSWSDTTIVVPVPAVAAAGAVIVTVAGVLSNGSLFSVIPNITGINPASGAWGTSVTINGTGFGPMTGSVSFNGVNGIPVSWSPSSIVVTVPTGATSGPVIVNSAAPSSGFAFAVIPIIAGLTPTSGPAGASVSIAGTGFGAAQGASTVTFNGITATPTSWSATNITAPVPAGATTGNVVVTVGGQASNGVTFSVTPPPPNITNLNPSSGAVGALILISGANFGASQGTSTVTFNGTSAGLTVPWSSVSISAQVPAGATTGNLVVTVGGVASNGIVFTVTPPPSISSLSPTSGPVGTGVTVTGSNFGTTQGTSAVTFNGTTAAVTNWTGTSIAATVPTGATTGNVVVTVGGVASNGMVFTVPTAPIPINLVQHTSKDAGTTSSASLAFGASNTSGNFIAVSIRAGHSGQVFGVRDSRGNTYRQAVLFNQTLDTPNGDTLAIFYAENIAAGANTVTVSDSISNNTLRFAVLEYSGVAPANSLDVTAMTQGTGASASSGNATTTAAGDLLLGALMTGSGVTYTAGTGFTVEERVPAAPNTKLIAEDQIQAPAGGVAATANLSATASWGAALAAFKAATGGGSTAPAISNLNPASGPVGSPVTITGTNFGTAQGTSTVTFNGIVAAPTNWSTTSISVPVPTSVAMGSANIVVTVNNVASNSATFTVTAPPAISVALTPVRGGLTITQPLSLTAAVQNDPSNAGVSWTASGGMLSNMTNLSATFTATSPGVYTITGTSKADVTKSASAVIGVTDLSGVGTWRNDNSRSGVNSQEYALTPQNVSTSTFGKLFSCAVDGQVFAQPLWVANVSVGGKQHNVVFVATENDSLYAFDADSPGCKPVWSKASVSLIPSGEVIVPFADLQNDNALGPVVGITGTPVIDTVSQTIYLVALTEDSGRHVIQRLHAIDIATGLERTGSPQIISASVTGAAGYDNSNGTISFAPNFEKQRPALLLLNGVIYISWAGFLDTDFYHGWLIGYDATTLAQVTVFNDTIDGGRGGIWMSGGGPAADSQGNIYLLTGNGDFNANTGGRNYGDTFMKLGTSGGLSVSDWFTPFDQANLAANDLDLGGGGAVILLDQPSGPFPHLILGGGKAGTLYVVNRDSLGRFNSANDSQIVQHFTLGSNGIYSAPLFWQNTLFGAASGSPLGAYTFSSSTCQFQTSPSVVSSQTFGHPGTTPSLSAAGTSNAILWAIRRSLPTNPAVLHAFDPNNIHTALWDSSQAPNNRDAAGVAVKFTVPTVANGRVYIGTQTELDVYGLLPN